MSSRDTLIPVLHRRFDFAGIQYALDAQRGRAARPFPLDPFDARLASAELRTLEALWFEDRLIETDAGYQLPTAELYRLVPSELEALRLPKKPSEVRVRLRTHGYAGAGNFAIAPLTYSNEGTELPEERRRGAVFLLADELVFVPEAVGELYRVLDEGWGRRKADQLRWVARVKDAAETAAAELDLYLANQDVFAPAGIGVDVEVEHPEYVRLTPTPEGVDAGAFPALATGPTRRSYFRAEGTRRVRLELDEEDQRIADEIKQHGELRGADVPRFFENPEAFLPDGIDLSHFSRRVRGLIPRKYNSQPYVRLEPAESRDWFALDVGVELAAETFTPAGLEGTGDAAASGEETSPEGDGSGTLSASPPHVSPAEYADLCRESIRTGESYVLHDGTWIEIEPTTAEQYLAAWEAAEETTDGGRRISREQARLVLDVISNLDELEFVDIPAAEELVTRLPEYALPASLVATLMPHQQDGYRWIRYLHEQQLGGLLADDMGLGKTVQVIGFLAHLADAGQLGPALIVVPSSLIENWRRELARFCPRIRRVYVHQGPGRLKQPERLASQEVVITTYETLRRDQLILGKVDWTVIACDEAQKVKNPTAQSTSAVKGMKAKLRLALTGTPVENGLSELWCIVDWAQPGKLGSQREFRNLYELPMQAAEADEQAEIGQRLQCQLVPHYLRRIKEDVLEDLPERKADVICRVPLGARQRSQYVEMVRRVKSGEVIPIAALQCLLALTSHPELYEQSGKPIDRLIEECPKLQETLALLEQVQRKGERAIVFTRLRRMQSILQEAIIHRFDVHAPILNGDVASSRRQSVVDRFNDDPRFGVLILSPEAAGVGLNITGANHVIHYTRLWNPAKENQATDRVHRIGQTKPVTVYYPIVEGDGEVQGVEERLHRLLEEKRHLARNVVRPRGSLSVEGELLDFLDTAAAA